MRGIENRVIGAKGILFLGKKEGEEGRVLVLAIVIVHWHARAKQIANPVKIEINLSIFW
jgi:hypothetical protein